MSGFVKICHGGNIILEKFLFLQSYGYLLDVRCIREWAGIWMIPSCWHKTTTNLLIAKGDVDVTRGRVQFSAYIYTYKLLL